MTNQGKGPRWIADQILAAFEATHGTSVLAELRQSRIDVDEMVSQALSEALVRVEEREKPSPPAPLPRAGEG